MYLSGYKHQLVTWSNSMKPEGLYGEFDHVLTSIYISIDTLKDTLLPIFTFVIDNHSRFLKKMLKKRHVQIYSLSPRASILWRSNRYLWGIDTHCSSQCYVGRNSCKCKYRYLQIRPLYLHVPSWLYVMGVLKFL
jgi:hypothetical protein